MVQTKSLLRATCLGESSLREIRGETFGAVSWRRGQRGKDEEDEDGPVQSGRRVSDDAVGRSQPCGLLTFYHDQIEVEVGVVERDEPDVGDGEEQGVCVVEDEERAEESESHPERTGRRGHEAPAVMRVN